MRPKWNAAAASIPVGLFAAELAGGFGGPAVVRYVDDLETFAVAFLAAFFCLRAARRNHGRLRTFWHLLAAAVGSWCLGELMWAVYDLPGNGSVPVPSWADAAYLAAVPLAAAALLAHPALHGRTTGKARAILDASALAASLFFVSWMELLGPLWRSSDLTTGGGLVTLAYPAGDVLLLFLIVLVIRGTTDRDRRDLWILLVGLGAMTCSDGAYAYLQEVAGYATGNLIDIGWVAGYIGIAAGAYVSRPQRAAEPVPPPSELTRAALVAPFVPVLAALGLAAVEIQLGHELDRVAWVAAVVVVCAVLIRQVLLAIDLRRGSESDVELPRRLLSSLGETQS